MENYTLPMDYNITSNITFNISNIANATTSPGLSVQEDSDSNAKYINSMINIICRPILIIMGTIGKYSDYNLVWCVQETIYLINVKLNMLFPTYSIHQKKQYTFGKHNIKRKKWS